MNNLKGASQAASGKDSDSEESSQSKYISLYTIINIYIYKSKNLKKKKL